MQLQSLLGHCTELIRIIRKSPQPADAIAREYLRSRKYIGAADRRFITSTTFRALRILLLAETYAAEHGTDIATAAHQLDSDSDWVHRQPEELQICTQPWLLQSTLQRWPDAAGVWRAMMQPAPVGIRVNLRRTTREAVLKEFINEGIEVQAGLHAPAAIIISQRINLLQHPLYLNGFIEIQDEGSQCISLAAGASPGMRVLDACAGAGGKSLHLADIMNNQGAIVSRDIEWQRLKEIPIRARRAGITIITTEQIAPSRGRIDTPAKAPFDVVLIDAPCSGLGTARRNPMVKWRLTPEQTRKYARKQLQLLTQYAAEARLGGTVVYATCSILPEENEHVVDRFLGENPNYTLEYQQQYDPYHHGTDGLYLARLHRE